MSSAGMLLYKSNESGFNRAPRSTTSSPEIILFTATSTFLPLIVYYNTENHTITHKASNI